MTKEEREEYVKNRLMNFQEELLNKIDKIPDEWSRAEMILWMYESFENSISASATKSFMGKRRIADCRNDILVRNL